MQEQDLDAVYTQLCHTMTRLGEAQMPLFLARFALLAMQQLGDPAQVQRIIEAAAADLSPAVEDTPCNT